MSKLAHSNEATAFKIMIDRMKENGEMPRQFREKLVLIEAVHFDGSGQSCDEVSTFLGGPQMVDGPVVWNANTKTGGTVRTKFGPMPFGPGDWIYRSSRGNFYPCKPDIFAAIYEPVI